MFGRALELIRNRREHLVVEIKRPTVVIGRQPANQIEDYAQLVPADSALIRRRLTGTSLSSRANPIATTADRASQQGQPRGLIFHPQGSNLKIWTRTWGDIIEECKQLREVRPDAVGV
jgi:hypothetical protein